MIKLVGLTGGIGSGKSTVAGMIRERGIPVLDADVIAREVVEPGRPAHAEIALAWPQVITGDGTIDRKRLGEIVFADKQAKARLEAITHPRIRERIAAQVAALDEAGHRLAFLEAALLVETGLHATLDGLVVVAASESVQVERVSARDGCSLASALARIRSQHPLAEKIRVADHVIDNEGKLEATRARLYIVLQAL
jgi:dephospho-CoA kinase